MTGNDEYTVDVHAHVIPQTVVNAMRSGDAPDGIRIDTSGGQPWVVHRQGYRYPLLPAFHDPEARVSAMDTLGVDVAVLSVAPPLFCYHLAAGEGAELARMLNDGMAATVADAPERLAALATLPLQDPDAAVRELTRAVTELGLRGAEVGTHAEGVPLDDPSLRPLLQRAAELRAPLLIHPSYVGASPGLEDFYLTNLQGNPWQSAVCASRLILSGALDDVPDLAPVLVHGGGHLPYQIGRLDHGHRVRSEAQHCTHPPSDYLRRFHADTLTHRPSATGWLIDEIGADRVLFGTDLPFDMGGPALADQLAGIELDAGARADISHRNAGRLFGLPSPEGTNADA